MQSSVPGGHDTSPSKGVIWRCCDVLALSSYDVDMQHVSRYDSRHGCNSNAHHFLSARSTRSLEHATW
jgi:hypothetical protein